jgi:hypothetical protein
MHCAELRITLFRRARLSADDPPDRYAEHRIWGIFGGFTVRLTPGADIISNIGTVLLKHVMDRAILLEHW